MQCSKRRRHWRALDSGVVVGVVIRWQHFREAPAYSCADNFCIRRRVLPFSTHLTRPLRFVACMGRLVEAKSIPDCQSLRDG
jgi:hypothetical protein